MNRLNSPKKILFLTIIGLVTFVSSIQPILAHSGHNHQQPKQKNPSIEENNRDLVEEETKVNQQKLETQLFSTHDSLMASSNHLSDYLSTEILSKSKYI